MWAPRMRRSARDHLESDGTDIVANYVKVIGQSWLAVSVVTTSGLSRRYRRRNAFAAGIVSGGQRADTSISRHLQLAAYFHCGI